MINSGTVLCLGELLLRLSLQRGELLARGTALDVHVGGAEANVAVALACLGNSSRMLSALPDGSLGDLALAHLRQHGVDTAWVGRGLGRMGLYFLEPGASLRRSVVRYDRASSRFLELNADAIDWDGAFDGVGHLHLSGITPALGPASAELGLQAARHARAAQITVSFDCNYRQQLWEQTGGNAAPVLRKLIAEVDILFGGSRDATLLFDCLVEPEGAAAAFFDAFPRLSLVASTDRKLIAADHHHLTGRLSTRDGNSIIDSIEIPGVIDRIGTGDAFVAGILHSLLLGAANAEMLASGLALAALKHSVAGDATTFTAEDLMQFRSNERDVSR